MLKEIVAFCILYNPIFKSSFTKNDLLGTLSHLSLDILFLSSFIKKLSLRQSHFKELMDEFVEKDICELRNEFWCVCTLINHGHRLYAKPAHTIGIV